MEQQPPEDKKEELVHHTLDTITNDYGLIGKARIKPWQAWLVVGVIADSNQVKKYTLPAKSGMIFMKGNPH